MPENWNEHRMHVLSELKNLRESVDKMGESVEKLSETFDAKFSSIQDNVKKLDVQTAVLNTKSSVWGALGGVVTTIAVLLLSYFQGHPHENPVQESAQVAK